MDWNYVTVSRYWGKHWRSRFPHVNGELDARHVEEFLSLRIGPDGRPILHLFGPVELIAKGQWRLPWLKFDATGLDGWLRAWHGCPFEAVYSIAYHGKLFASSDPSKGHRLKQNAVGVYVHGDRTKYKADNYSRFVAVFGDHVFWRAKWEVLFDRRGRINITGTDQWCQAEDSVRLCDLCLCAKRPQDMEDGDIFQDLWDPILEVHLVNCIFSG